MAQRELGQTGLKAFPIGLGTVKLGRNLGVKYPSAFDLPDDAAVESLLARALELGVNFLDTAPAYGTSEARLGPFVKAHRERIVLCSKAGETWDGEASHFDFSARSLERSVEESLRRLRTDSLDLLLVHSDGRDEEILTGTDALEGLARIKSAGKARAVGISAKTEAGIDFAARELDAVMAPFGIGHPELGAALERARRAGCATLAIKVLAQGHLPPPGEGAEPVAAALDHVLGARGIDLAVVGTANPDHLAAVVAAARRKLGADA